MSAEAVLHQQAEGGHQAHVGAATLQRNGDQVEADQHQRLRGVPEAGGLAHTHTHTHTHLSLVFRMEMRKRSSSRTQGIP